MLTYCANNNRMQQTNWTVGRPVGWVQVQQRQNEPETTLPGTNSAATSFVKEQQIIILWNNYYWFLFLLFWQEALRDLNEELEENHIQTERDLREELELNNNNIRGV